MPGQSRSASMADNLSTVCALEYIGRAGAKLPCLDGRASVQLGRHRTWHIELEVCRDRRQNIDDAGTDCRGTGYPDAKVRLLPEWCRPLPWEEFLVFFLGEFAGEAEKICPRSQLRRVLDRTRRRNANVMSSEQKVPRVLEVLELHNEWPKKTSRELTDLLLSALAHQRSR